MFHPLATRILGAENKTKQNLEPGTRVIQSLNTFLHFLPTATEDSVAFARNPTSSLVHTNAVLWLLCFLAGAFMLPVLCLFARFYALCFVVFFLSFECIGGSVSVQFAGLAFTLQLFHCLHVDKSNSTCDATSVAFETKV